MPSNEDTKLHLHGGCFLFITFCCFLAVICFITGGFMNSFSGEEEKMQHISNIYLWTRQNQLVAEELPLLSVPPSSSHFSSYRTTYVITHGFLSSALYNWVSVLKDALLSHSDCNVLAVSWQSGSSSLSYYSVQSRVPQVGEEVGRVLQYLLDHAGLSSLLLHLIGHSLGAHVSGFAGKYLNGTLARITGLDPAGMGFNGAAPGDRLDKTDAQFVDVIHTHACSTLIQTYKCYGIVDSIGHVDVWVNGGLEQPACQEDGDGERILEDGSPCSHSLSYVYYTESLEYPASSTRYIARRCASPGHYHNGSCACPAYPQYMGFHANSRTLGDFYVNTSSVWPYGLLDQDCPAAAYTVLQLLGLVVLSVSAAVVVCVLGMLTWLHWHPEDKEFFSKDFLLTVVEVLVETCHKKKNAFVDHDRGTWTKNVSSPLDESTTQSS
ncbi:Lipase/vitellogenin [Trinorchestia longiramus]|nr:Lipase/vitellogenin [Trinorchestia longiramus]